MTGELKACVGCRKQTTGMCHADCGMAICGSPLCNGCQHVDEPYGWRHEPRVNPVAAAFPDKDGFGEKINLVRSDLVEAQRTDAYRAGMLAGLEAAAHWLLSVPDSLPNRQEYARHIRAIANDPDALAAMMKEVQG